MIDEIQYLRDGLSERDAEIERLRMLLAEKRDAVTHWKTQLNEALAEIERLRAALEEIKAMCNRGESHTWIGRIARKAFEQ